MYDEESLAELEVSSIASAALARAAIRATVLDPLSTANLFAELVENHPGDVWEAVEQETAPFASIRTTRFLDSCPEVSDFEGAPATKDVKRAFKFAVNFCHARSLPVLSSEVLVLSLVSDPESGLSRALLEGTSLSHDRLLRLLGQTVCSDADFSQLMTDARLATEASDKTNRRANPIASGVGVAAGVAALAVFGGIPVGGAVVLGVLVTYIGTRRHLFRQLPRFASAASVVAVVGALLLVALGWGSLSETVDAARELEHAKAALYRDDTTQAMIDLARVNLSEPGSVSGQVLSACVAWQQGFKDDALVELQYAFIAGYSPGEDTHYQGGRNCFADILEVASVDYLQYPQGHWYIFPRPNTSDTVSQRLLEIARTATGPNATADIHTALGCVADRYDFRFIASFHMTLGLNAAVFKLEYPELLRCINDPAFNRRYGYYMDPQSGIDVYVPRDLSSRIGSPSDTTPPEGACWTEFPVGGPCNATK